MIHLERIEKRFGERLLFRDLSWLIGRDARIGLVGPNGAGKTTLLRLVAELESPDAGRVHRAGRVAVGYLPQEIETLRDGHVLAVVLDGVDALRALRDRLRTLELELAERRSDAAGQTRLLDAYGEARHEYERLGGDAIDVKARVVLTGLGIGPEKFDTPLGRLSGGWRMRVALARLLVAAPDLLLLDEPTNHLDLDALRWLEGFLEDWPGAFVVVSHDRYFLNRVVRTVIDLDQGRLTTYRGGYDDYLREREARRAALVEAAAEQAREVARVMRFAERFRYKATKARQVQSRLRALEKTEKIEVVPNAKTVRFGFPPAPRSGEIVARLEGVGKRYGETIVFDGVDLRLRRGDRLALIGPNGSGKSTLLALLLGRLPPDDGRVELGHNVVPVLFAQHQLEDLDPRANVLEELARASAGTPPQRLRTILGGFLFSGEEVEKKVGVLSGGEKARLALARILVRSANLLLLDEPTNHLDVASREAVEEALDEYEGTLVVVSHDRYFLNRVATSVAEVGNGRVETYPGDYDTFVERAGPAPTETAAATTKSGLAIRREARRAEAEERNERYRRRKAVEDILGPLEAEIGSLEERIRELERSQADPDVYSDPDAARAAGREKLEAERRLADLYARWEDEAGRLEP